MVALWILGILLALILLVLFLRVGVRIAFGDELRVIAVAGPLRLQIVPKPQRRPKKRRNRRSLRKNRRKSPRRLPRRKRSWA